MSANIAEGWSRRKYPKSIILKLVESEGEASETTVHLDFAKDILYINNEKHSYFIEKYKEVCKMLNSMINKPEKFCGK